VERDFALGVHLDRIEALYRDAVPRGAAV
jgi:hypothetical protein